MTTEIDFEQLVRGIGDGVIVCDAAGAITFWNDAATRIFGFTASDALGHSLDLIIPERQRQRHWDGYHKTAATGETRYGNDLLRVPALHKEGKPLSIAFTVAMLYDPAGQVASVIAVVRDDTARWSEERALKARVRELEAAARSEPVAS
ncbi:PAS domain-containing protein [Pseudoduganella albidiflava]|uniref:PAS domain S-box protein n=1 Tax=Pseudoduganella albidiflava TaxID=321983 RepID=A0A411X4G0_9BURK|nr:PAS domain-containing protein [Pseudoduganella albidiflava]QBI03880.1 PAS domain S-box protein [Pseudoduganella albidiflava]GGY22959.1 transcriptional regulator [Pseudoduganella albidiflava]